jgi:hypothetical protein
MVNPKIRQNLPPGGVFYRKVDETSKAPEITSITSWNKCGKSLDFGEEKPFLLHKKGALQQMQRAMILFLCFSGTKRGLILLVV